ncbi:DUF262 domain-containing protein [Erwinia sorbitola]|uniref:DUF262 domain-containing protein n=1 Tax=Erwinia sorbitola TaxID=2681984 RepID=A0A6I6ETB8_9GAMM|nr:DUF262 domain-containing protein [Erwinia sorbitola]MTD25913.1 DUF262 domain-containing protein [Erwinia sorbitola]QGU87543.1 DUF262 domain-containing protein [Erwinia sorbitola]
MSLRPVSALLNEHFFIPSYQRGYRWTALEVKDLLDDIAEFRLSSHNNPRDSFYCLQPVVVKKKHHEWELVDGQQRLTTLYLILRYLKEMAAPNEFGCYSLRFESRPHSEQFLQDISPELAQDNIDFHHIVEAWETINSWFSAKSAEDKTGFLATLLGSGNSGSKNVRVIWYQLHDDADATTVFSRLNHGKIALSNGELVKALLLQSANFVSGGRSALHQQQRLAQEWDEIEKRLQQSDFWYFISNQQVESNRIEFILSIIAAETDSPVPRTHPSYLFLTFASMMKHAPEDPRHIEKLWARIRQRFMMLNEWFENHETYHLVGYLISMGETIRSVITLHNASQNKPHFILLLKERILHQVHPAINLKQVNSEEFPQLLAADISALDYPDKRLRALLLLFNIAILLCDKQSLRFQFSRYKNDRWDIEHISAVSSQIPGDVPGQKAWTKNIRDHLRPDDNVMEPDDKLRRAKNRLHQLAAGLLAHEPFDADKFSSLFNRVQKTLNKKRPQALDNSIGNLTLLDSTTNRSYKNAIFPIKRLRIIEADKNGTFIPVATKNVFLKYYSRSVDNMTFWTIDDHHHYQNAIGNTLANFFQGGTQ